MIGRGKALVVLIAVLLLGLIACRNVEVREESGPEIRYVRIFDVEVQDEEDIVYQQHNARAGVLTFIDGTNQMAEVHVPFANQMRMIEKETEIQIDYVMLKSWDELPAKLEEAQKEDVTTIVLYNNSFDGSLLREANSGKYADMETALQELGFYDKEAYNQTVLKAGMTEKGQVLVPILYNVSGMIQGDPVPYNPWGEWRSNVKSYEYDEWKEMAIAHAQEATLDYASFLGKLKDSMRASDVEEMDVPFLSPAFLEDKVDLFLMASGEDLAAYEKQKELYTVVHNYLKCYDETQVKSKKERISNQQLYGKHLRENTDVRFINFDGSMSYLTSEIVEQLKIVSDDSDILATEYLMEQLVISMLDRTDYFVECSSAEEVAFHSVFGMLEYRSHYVYVQSNEAEIVKMGNMNYWPIGVLNSDMEYAAQPICYAAVGEWGSTRLAAEVLQSMMNQPTDVKYGISVCNSVKDAQLEKWKTYIGSDSFGNIRVIRGRRNEMTGEVEGVESEDLSYWGPRLTNKTKFCEDKEIYTSQIEKQIDNIVVARIPDREVLAIWQDTLTEAVDSGLSAEAGFELLCERMEKRNITE